jgi:hypothetical protein
MISLWELEEGIIYTSTAHDSDQLFRRKDHKLQVLRIENGLEKWYDIHSVDLRWFYVELPDQRNKCPKCQRSMITKKNAFIFLSKFYDGLYCRHCNILNEGPDVPKLDLKVAEEYEPMEPKDKEVWNFRVDPPRKYK